MRRDVYLVHGDDGGRILVAVFDDENLAEYAASLALKSDGTRLSCRVTRASIFTSEDLTAARRGGAVVGMTDVGPSPEVE